MNHSFSISCELIFSECHRNALRILFLYEGDMRTCLRHTGSRVHSNRPISQIPQCTSSIPHIAPFCNRNVHMCAHFCYKIVHCGIFAQCIVGFVRLVYYERISSCAGCPPQTTDHRASRATPPPTAVSSVLTTRPWHISQKLLWHWF